MTQIAVAKLPGYALIGGTSDQIASPKVVGYALLIPGSEEVDTSVRVSFVCSNVVRKPSR